LRSDWTHPLVNEALNPFPFVGFRCVDVALRIGGDTMHTEELTGLASTVTEAGEYLKRVALDDMNLFVNTVGNIDVGLVRILLKSNIPDRAGAQRLLSNECFPEKGAIWFKHLDSVV